MNSAIYEIRNNINNKFYIGSAVDFSKRRATHVCTLRKGTHKNKYLQAAWNKYGEVAFTIKPLIYCDKENLILYEQRFIDLLNPNYNLDRIAGSPMGRKLSQETKDKIGKANKGNKPWTYGKKLPQYLKDKLLTYSLGIPKSKETKEKISKSKTGISTSKKVYCGFISPDGITYRNIIGLKKFCDIKGLTYRNMNQVDRGDKKSHRGWTRIGESM